MNTSITSTSTTFAILLLFFFQKALVKERVYREAGSIGRAFLCHGLGRSFLGLLEGSAFVQRVPEGLLDKVEIMQQRVAAFEVDILGSKVDASLLLVVRFERSQHGIFQGWII